MKAGRGKLKIFFGASAGVGKTYAMLSAAQALFQQGSPLVIGVIESHGRAETELLTRNLPRLELKTVPYRDKSLQEFDLDAALAWGKTHDGGLILLDELAHSNVPGSRHPKRWQDIEELLDQGIDVWTTLNVQHLESLNDIVSGITGIRVFETVPDHIFDRAEDVVVVDLPPDELLQRLAAGKVYLPQQAERAVRNFFRKGNLLALRELALRRTADRVDSEMQVFRRRNSVQSVWPNRESLLACVEPGKYGEKIVRSCARLATQLGVPWHALHIETPDWSRQSPEDQKKVLDVLKLARELGANTATFSASDIASALVGYARRNNLSRLVIGRRKQHRPWQQSMAEQIVALSDDLDILQVALPAGKIETSHPVRTEITPQPNAWHGYAAAVVTSTATALLAMPLLPVIELSNIVMLFLLTVVAVGLHYGRGPAVVAALVGVGLFDFIFVSPRFSLAVTDAQYLITFAVMLAVALIIGQLTAGLKTQARAAIQREHRISELYEMSRNLSAALIPGQIAEISARFLAAELNTKSALLVIDKDDHLYTLPNATAPADLGMAQWVFEQGKAAGSGTDTLPGNPLLMLPLKTPMQTRGVLVLEPGEQKLGPDQLRLLDTCASLVAIALERIHYIDIAQKNTLQIESERLRNSLLSSISHDLRTPLTALVGLADTLETTQPAPAPRQREIIDAIKQSSRRMNTLINNVLDMARLEAGPVQLNRAWQPLEEVIGSALSFCAPGLEGHPVSVRLADDLPLLNLDAVLMERVFVNLLENAAKYTPPGRPIDIAAQRTGTHVLIIVDDAGPGLQKGLEGKIFEKFERGDRETAISGTGLGLAICRSIIEAHGGTISARNRGRSEQVSGARFEISLPVGNPPADDGSEISGLPMTEIVNE